MERNQDSKAVFAQKSQYISVLLANACPSVSHISLADSQLYCHILIHEAWINHLESHKE